MTSIFWRCTHELVKNDWTETSKKMALLDWYLKLFVYIFVLVCWLLLKEQSLIRARTDIVNIESENSSGLVPMQRCAKLPVPNPMISNSFQKLLGKLCRMKSRVDGRQYHTISLNHAGFYPCLIPWRQNTLCKGSYRFVDGVFSHLMILRVACNHIDGCIESPIRSPHLGLTSEICRWCRCTKNSERWMGIIC